MAKTFDPQSLIDADLLAKANAKFSELLAAVKDQDGIIAAAANAVAQARMNVASATNAIPADISEYKAAISNAQDALAASEKAHADAIADKDLLQRMLHQHQYTAMPSIKRKASAKLVKHAFELRLQAAADCDKARADLKTAQERYAAAAALIGGVGLVHEGTFALSEAGINEAQERAVQAELVRMNPEIEMEIV